MQSASTVLLVRPARFAFNPETAASNSFQQHIQGLDAASVQAQAFAEFDALAVRLRSRGVQVLVVADTPTPAKPDAVFPNNWVTFHADGRVLLYPMCAPSRRAERRPDILEALAHDFRISQVLDISGSEQHGRYLEGTGSIVFDHVHRVAYACLSARTDAGLLEEVCAQLQYRPVAFRAQDAQGHAIYHTNVMLCVGTRFAVVCLESIADASERALVQDSLERSGHEIVTVSLAQVARFAGNMLELQPTGSPTLLALSQSAHDALTPEQRHVLSCYADLLPLSIPTIETIGGGSVRCMLAEVFLPKK
ncbi:citrulline utilization hydrolase CtlX [Hymenobacter psychrotolerans]|uniref:Amidinotransferase n=1 Tax=Hymenobacter psychrotolerans DSM 18569 TaxID=1121959 RepID=A0A1M7DDA6_9BACT|nr:arginine deiminase-related protein [Hymenobacter psychrotolerans]SHL77491.1 hypothetical protein SAMN02746009_03348 [Hymenobacter psychrotolerans DSM 18569]